MALQYRDVRGLRCTYRMYARLGSRPNLYSKLEIELELSCVISQEYTVEQFALVIATAARREC
jgi:hypothetical protein